MRTLASFIIINTAPVDMESIVNALLDAMLTTKIRALSASKRRNGRWDWRTVSHRDRMNIKRKLLQAMGGPSVSR